MIKKKIKLDFLPITITLVIIENKDEDYCGIVTNMRDTFATGRTITNNHGGVCIAIDSSTYNCNLEYLSHEIEHAVDYIEEYINQETIPLNEYRAYLIGYLNKRITTYFLESGYTIQKDKGDYFWIKNNKEVECLTHHTNIEVAIN